MNDRTDKEILELIDAWSRSLVPEQAGFIRGLADLEPEIRPLIAEHVHDYDEILPTLLMSDIARWVTRVARDHEDPPARLAPLFARLEDAWGDGQNPVSDLIAVSFVENIFDESEVVKLLGPKLARHYRIHTGQEKVRSDEKRPIPNIVEQVLKKLGRS
ncbi:hypothetical protein OH799_11380 [Nocardia sp. NBC_00881]|uniref:DUF7674 family protein n=1 Tax=Nocardia sp. NBC_00881 TaxID=2975995 RepID=UPI003868DCC6|nr:hypothetical protein OH799_11380 [Nocardia sp. NBC_00881]